MDFSAVFSYSVFVTQQITSEVYMEKLLSIFAVLLVISIGALFAELPSRAETKHNIQLILK